MTRIVLAVALLAAGGYVLWRALQGGGPLLFFASAVLVGMAIGALQQVFRRERP